MKKLIVILSVCLVLMLGFLFVLETREEPPQETEPLKYTVSFELGGTLLSQQELTENELPQIFYVELTGAKIVGWLDAKGENVDPFSASVREDISYEAVVRPELSAHKPFLFKDVNGLLHPDAPLTRQALSQALDQLATEDAKAYFPQLPRGSVAITAEELTETLSHFYKAEEISAVFSQTDDITRAAFAQGMCTLLGRDAQEQFTLTDPEGVPSDITMERADAWVLLEACMEHTPAQDGSVWTDIPLVSSYEPGFVNVDGWLYYVQEDGYFLRDGYVGSLYFDADGRYTCSDPALDEKVATLLKDMIQRNPDADRFELLRIVFDHCHQNYSYRRIYEGNPEYAATGWEIDLAKDMFESTKGNCYSFSAVFWALSRGLGYETRAISGVCLSDVQPHSWCIIELDGEDFIFDPQWQYNYTERGIDHWDMFKIPMDQIYIWLYEWEE